MENDKILSIMVQLGVIGEDQLGEARSTLEGLKQSTGDLSQSLPQGAEAFQKYKDILGKTGEQSLSARESTHALHLTLMGMGAELPGLGILLRGLFNPVTMGLSAGVAVEEVYFGWLKKREEKYRDLIVLAQKVNDDIKEIIRSGKSEDEQFVEFNRLMAEAQAHGKGLAVELQRDADFADLAREAMDAALDRAAQLHQDTASLQKDFIAMFEAMGKITPAQSQELKAQVEHAAKLKQMEDERAKAVAEVAARQAELNQARSDVAAAGDPDNLLHRKQDADESADRLEKIITSYNKIQGDITAAQRAAEEAAKKHGMDSTEFFNAQKLLLDANVRRENIREQYESAKAQLPGADANRADADKMWTDLQAAQDKLQGLTTELEKARQKLADLNAAQSGRIAAENQQYGVEQTTRAIQNGQTPEQIFNQGATAMASLNRITQLWGEGYMEIERRGRDAIAARDQLKPGQALTSTQERDISRYELEQKYKAQIDDLKNLLSALGMQADSVIGAMNTSLQHATSTNAAIKAVQGQLAGLKTEMDNLRANLMHR